MDVRIYLTGRVAVEVDGTVVVDEWRLRGRQGRQGRLAFAYLACEWVRTVPREELATILWPTGPSPVMG